MSRRPLSERVSNFEVPLFTFRVIRVKEYLGQRIIEYCFCLCKSDTMLTLILFSFALVPCKQHRQIPSDESVQHFSLAQGCTKNSPNAVQAAHASILAPRKARDRQRVLTMEGRVSARLQEPNQRSV